MININIIKSYHLLRIFLTFIVIFLVFSDKVKADIIMPPTDIFWTPFTIVVFLFNLFLNFIIFGIGYLIFIERNIHKINKKSFFVILILITLLGFFADSITLLFYNNDSIFAFISAIILASFLIFIFNYFIYRFYLKLNVEKSILLGMWMSFLTNPFLYIFLTGFISELLTPFVPYKPVYPT